MKCEENEMCVKLYSERRAVEVIVIEGRTDTTERAERWNEGENKRTEQKVERECCARI